MSKNSNYEETKLSLQSSRSSNKSYSFENYEKIRTVGKGAFGTAVLYKRLSDSREVVLKEVNMSELSSAERQMALNEVEVLSVLHHPNIIRSRVLSILADHLQWISQGDSWSGEAHSQYILAYMHLITSYRLAKRSSEDNLLNQNCSASPTRTFYLGSFESDGLLVIEMEFANGGTLAQYIGNTSGPLPELEILSIFKEIVAAIQYMHQHNILHRDLKTVNIFLTNDQVVKVGDFGISKVMNTKSAANTVLGTPYYISPEMCEGKEYDEKSDIWALGCILYELACREKTFQGSNLPALVNKIMKGVYEPLPSIYSSGLKLLVSDLLQKEPNLRPPASVISSRVTKLYEKIKQQKSLSTEQLNYKSKKIRSVLYQLSGHGASFQLLPMKLPPKSKILTLAVGSTHYIVLTSDMLVYSWGEGKRGQLGHEGAPHWLDEPRILDSLVSKSINKIGAGNGFSVFVTDTGMVFTCGDGTSGSLGHGNWNDVTTPKLIEKLLNVDVVSVSCGDNHMACLTKDGSVYISGTLPSGESLITPQELELPKGSEALTISCGPNVTGIITKNGELLVCGSNEGNRLGLNHRLFTYQKEVPRVEKMSLVKSLKKWKVASVSFGKNHTAIVTRSGQVVTMGSNNDSQLGHDSPGPALAKHISHRIVTMAKCGPTYTLIATIDNALYFWGTRFTQGEEMTGNSRVSMSTIETFAVSRPEEILVLYASKEMITEGLTLRVTEISPLWHCLFVLVDTTAPFEEKKPLQLDKETNQEKDDYDTLGPIPDWIKMEIAKSTHEWPGTLSLKE